MCWFVEKMCGRRNLEREVEASKDQWANSGDKLVAAECMPDLCLLTHIFCLLPSPIWKRFTWSSSQAGVTPQFGLIYQRLLSHLPETVRGLLLAGVLIVGPRHGHRFGRAASGCVGLQRSDALHALSEKTSTEKRKRSDCRLHES